MLMPKIAANPVRALKTIAIQGFSFLRLDKTANSMLINATPPNRTRMVATSAARSSIGQLSQTIAVIGWKTYVLCGWKPKAKKPRKTAPRKSHSVQG
jgi:hypothetical protein